MKFSAMLFFAVATIALADDAKLSNNKWFSGVKGYQDALDAQKQNGADIFVYFARYFPNDEEGLCKWWEKKGLSLPQVNDYLGDYIKVKILYPLSKKDEEAVQDFKVGKCPTIVVVQTNGFKSHCKVFEWTNKKPELMKPEDIIAGFRARSDPRYQAAETK